MASKWFSNKSFKLSLPHRRRKSDPPSPPVSPPAIQDPGRTHKLQEAFHHFDGDGDGKISSEELRAFFVSIGENMSLMEAETAINSLDSDGDDLMDFSDFLRLMDCDRSGDHGLDDLRMAFEMFEADKGSGLITPSGLQQMLNRLGDPKSYQECEAMIQVFDLDGNGVLDFHEFQQMMT